MIKNIHVPLDLSQQGVQVADIFVQPGERIRRKQLLMLLKSGNIETPLQSQFNGWVKHIAVKFDQDVAPGDLLLIIDVMEDNDYRIEGDISPESELGQDGRRGLEREAQKQLADGIAAPLFDAPQQTEGNQQHHGVKQHPFLQNAKEGVPPKMSHAENNHPAVDQLAEDASSNQDLANKLDAKLQQRLGTSPGPSAAPTLTLGG
ncbi:MAG: acetyl-CoA carboxylase biotin carboxyl carrier protein subunit [Gammaproteobacteria bacterium]|nr:acetyl-CoA carboxylase biotin carboxyl carrier protein subunit [Gammaproteobacteria bacterium]MCH9744558.1 acetyl-CoA carboxylase biotin carboxyl carrier protein subunit [Gammaproteobacteria bacterium]